MSSTEKEEPGGSSFGEGFSLEQDGEDLGEGQPAEEGKQIGREGVKGGMAAHGRVLAVGAGQQVGIGGSLNAGDGQLQQDVPEDDGPAAGLPGAPVQQGGVQQALGEEIGDADEQKLAALAVFPAPRQRQLDDEGDAQPPEETDDLLMRAVGFIQCDGAGGERVAVGAGEGQCGDLGGGFAAQIQTVDAIEGIALGDGTAKEGVAFGEVEQQLELLRGK